MTFTIRRNTADASSEVTYGNVEPTTVVSVAETVTGRLQGLRLLVVEDNRINQQVAREVLVLEGAHVELASTGRECIERVAGAGAPFDAVLMDIQMPDMDGYAATRHIRTVLGKKHLPIIATTANVLPADRENCLAAGMNDHVRKPINVEHLMDVLQRHCGRRCTPGVTGQPFPAVSSIDQPGFALGEALTRLGSNRVLYARMAREFVTGQAGTMADLRSLLERGEADRAVHTLHTLKGVAATLGATALTCAASDLEANLRSGIDPAARSLHLQHMEITLRAACSTLGNIADEIDTPPGEAAGMIAAKSAPELISSLMGFEELLKSGNMRAADEYLEIRQFIGQELREQLNELDHAMSRLDFPAAAATCRCMREVLA